MKKWLRKWLGIDDLVFKIEGQKIVNDGTPFYTIFNNEGIKGDIKELEYKIGDIYNTLFSLEKHLRVKKITEEKKTYYRRVK